MLTALYVVIALISFTAFYVMLPSVDHKALYGAANSGERALFVTMTLIIFLAGWWIILPAAALWLIVRHIYKPLDYLRNRVQSRLSR